MKCRTHPTYQIKREPRGQCLTCWTLWLNEQLKSVKRSLETLHQMEYERFW